jgi:hypothetical protein
MRTPDRSLARSLAKARGLVRRYGLVPFSDPRCPSIVSVVAGTPLTGSWWGHPAGQLIYQVGEALEGDPDILFVKLWRGKVTLLHRRMWPALLRVVTARAGWQTDGLGLAPRRLLALIDHELAVRSDFLPKDLAGGVQGFRPALRELERRLLVLTRSAHRDSGAHALVGESWGSWAKRSRVALYRGPVDSAQQELEAAATQLAPETPVSGSFPWAARSRPGR